MFTLGGHSSLDQMRFQRRKKKKKLRVFRHDGGRLSALMQRHANESEKDEGLHEEQFYHI